MVVLEPTREIRILRWIGAHSKDLRLIFGTEGMTVALIGALILALAPMQIPLSHLSGCELGVCDAGVEGVLECAPGAGEG
jgi:hypothetical protein